MIKQLMVSSISSCYRYASSLHATRGLAQLLLSLGLLGRGLGFIVLGLFTALLLGVFHFGILLRIVLLGGLVRLGFLSLGRHFWKRKAVRKESWGCYVMLVEPVCFFMRERRIICPLLRDL